MRLTFWEERQITHPKGQHKQDIPDNPYRNSPFSQPRQIFPGWQPIEGSGREVYRHEQTGHSDVPAIENDPEHRAERAHHQIDWTLVSAARGTSKRGSGCR